MTEEQARLAERERIAGMLESQPARYRRVGKPHSYDPYYEGWDDGVDYAAQLVRAGM